MTSKQKEIIRILTGGRVMSVEEIYKRVSWSYYHRPTAHLSRLLSNMVKRKMIERFSKGRYVIPYTPSEAAVPIEQSNDLYECMDEDDFLCCDDCDLPDACEDFGCAIRNGLRDPSIF